MRVPALEAMIRNTVSLLGALLTTVSAIAFLAMFGLELAGVHPNPYVGIIFFLILPSAFVAGLFLIPIGIWLERRRIARGGDAARPWAIIDLNDARQRFSLGMVLALTVVNVVIISMAAYRGLEYMDSIAFCGQVCHEVMQPEFVAYQGGPHSRVKCVECHIGPGAPWFVRSKLSGVRQVFAVSLNTFNRPIPSPVQELRPARDTCEECHWPTKFHGDKLDARREYADDEQNTESTTTLRLHVGGQGATGAVGIHWHVGEHAAIEYITTDDKRQAIPWVQLSDGSGQVREYTVEGVTPAQLRAGERRQMDCVDCHNRPSHVFASSAEKAVNSAMASGAIAKDLPFVHREAVTILKTPFASREAADAGIKARLFEFYQKQYPQVWQSRQADVERTVRSAQGLYSKNVFPAMRVDWGSYTNNIGHMDSPGCFRCHDDNHKSEDGRVIRQDCDLCHDIE